MRISFKGELSANYMVIENISGFSKNEFGVKMLEYNRIRSLLQFAYENMNGRINLLYDISSRQAMSAFFEGGRFSGEMLKSFVLSLKYLVDILEEYLLDADNIMLKKECIFTDPETGEFYYCYNPYYNGDFKLELGVIFDELLSAIDYEDPEAVKMAYDLHKVCHKENFTLEAMADKLDTDTAAYLPEVQTDEEKYGPEEEYMAESVKKEEPPRTAVAPVGLISKLSSYFKGKSIYDVVEDIDNGRIVKKIKESSPPEKVAAFRESSDYALLPESEIFMEEVDLKEQVFPETMILDGEYEACHRLVGLGGQQGRIIEVDRYPFTIGKLKGQSDAEINVPSVSRMHCRIHENAMKEDQYFLEDLNSKNGSYINNVRLTPYRKMPLRSGDIIKLAREEFCFR